MSILIPHLGQPYNICLSKAVAYDIIQQNPMTISYAIDKIFNAKANKFSFIFLKTIIPPYSGELQKYYKEEHNRKNHLKANNLLCRRLVQFLYWNKDNEARFLEEIDGDDYEIQLDLVHIENINLVKVLIEYYCNQLAPKEISYDVENNEVFPILILKHIGSFSQNN